MGLPDIAHESNGVKLGNVLTTFSDPFPFTQLQNLIDAAFNMHIMPALLWDGFGSPGPMNGSSAIKTIILKIRCQ